MDLNSNENRREKKSLLLSYKEKFQQDLSTKEIQFLMKVFGRTSTRFFCFGVLVFGLNVIFNRLLSDGQQLLFYLGLLAISLLNLIPLFFMRRRYETNPLSTSNAVKQGVFALVSFQFVAVFLMFMRVYKYVHDYSAVGVNYEVACALMTALVFGSAWIIYLIPVFIAWFVISRKQAIKLSKFVFRCCVTAFLLLVSVFVLCLSGYAGTMLNSVAVLAYFAIVSVIVFCSPIVTLYRFKATAHAINYDNEEETKGWSDYFGFIMLEQMLILAVHIMRLAINLVARR